MHRSGTSALAGALDRLGIQFESDHDHLEPSNGNPNGYFERQSIVNFSDSLLATQVWQWNVVSLNTFDIEKTVEIIPQGQALISNISGEKAIGIKDPRNCLIMPFWRRALVDRIEVVVITRDPAEVAWSLHVRNGLSVTAGLALWIAYSAHLARGIQGLSPHLVRYEDLVKSPTTQLVEVSKFLAERGVRVSDQETDMDLAAKSIDPTLRRATVPDWLNHHPLTNEARLIRELFHNSSASDLEFTPSELCREVLELQRTTQQFFAVNHELYLARIELGQVQREHVENTTQLTRDYVTAINLLETQRDEFQEKNHIQRNEIQNLKQELTQTHSQLVQVLNSLSLKMGLVLTWPIRKLRPANRKP